MRKVLLFVYSKMADDTNFSSKLPVADRTRESKKESSVGDALAHFPLSMFYLEL